MPCRACGGKEPAVNECKACRQHGCEIVTGCAMEAVQPETWSLIRAASAARKGHRPMDGGMLDQTESFTHCLQIAWDEEDNLRAQLKYPPLP